MNSVVRTKYVPLGGRRAFYEAGRLEVHLAINQGLLAAKIC